MVEQLFISHSVADRIGAPRGAWQWSQRRVSGIRGHSPAQRGVEITARFGLGTLGDANHAKLWANPTEGIQAAIRPFTNQSCLTRPERVSRMAARLDSLSIRAIRVPTALGHLGRRVPPTDGDRNAAPKFPDEPKFGLIAARHPRSTALRSRSVPLAPST